MSWGIWYLKNILSGTSVEKKYISLLIDKGNQSEKLQKHLGSYIAPKF